MGSKTVMMNPKPEGVLDPAYIVPPAKHAASLGIQSDIAFSEAAKRLCGRDLCSISDLTVEEMAAIMELAHAVKNHPMEDFRHALDAHARWCSSLRRRLCGLASLLRPPSTPSAATRSLSTRLSRRRWANVQVVLAEHGA